MVPIDDIDVEEVLKVFQDLDTSQTFKVGELFYLSDDADHEPVLILETETKSGIMFCTILHGKTVYEGVPAPVLTYFKGLLTCPI